MAYAIIEMGGKQYRVEEGDSVARRPRGRGRGREGLARGAVLFARRQDAVMDGADLGKVKVEAVVAEHLKGPKLRVFTYRPKKRIASAEGHRSLLSRLEIQEDHGAGRGSQEGAGAGGRRSRRRQEAKED